MTSRQPKDGRPPGGGPWRPWARAWHQALYGPDGFYRRHAPAEHFVTSVQGIPGAGELLAGAVLRLAREARLRHVVDLGCGRGELLTALHALDPDLRLTGVDVGPHPGGPFAWLSSPGGADLPPALGRLDDPEGLLVVAHEWLDVVPTTVAERDAVGVWRRVDVDAAHVDAHGRERLGPPIQGAELGWLERWTGAGVRRAEVGLARDRAATTLASLVGTGRLVLVDYGHTREDRPPAGTLTGFAAGREVRPVPDGSCDLTAHVAVDSLAAALSTEGVQVRVQRQREVLRASAGRPEEDLPGGHRARSHADPTLARTDPAAYLRGLARGSALATLTAPGGLGDFWWVIADLQRPGPHRLAR